MDTKYEALPEAAERIVYVRAIEVAELPDDVKSHAGGLERVYAVYTEAGERVALVKDRTMAFALARQNELAPVSVH
ncbi:hypothetical protein AQS8620_00540 [Aquimixticola soesokkakensis]|uniref:DUF1150 domain-containing protein n=1 Tax=Aquimixticola soesokkakensis TaxID=1519096 RepID=A0A1Y5RMK4_9RHOB|nr:DUF1150 family protein [Aquimixticola soesokkakensis]SLN20646.1 hypothetical protein AQS8620_00540 [Aquimixticola soesokkakensis]